MTVRRRSFFLLRRLGRLLAGKMGLPRVRCPVCGWKFTRFVDFGEPPRPNALCPRCGSLERHRLLRIVLEQRTACAGGGLDVLHFAPEGRLEKVLRAVPGLRYRTADLIEQEDVDLRVDITSTGLAEESIDLVICVHVLEHVPDDAAAFRELFRIMRPGGLALLMVPVQRGRAATFEDPAITTPLGRLEAYGQDDHVRLYGRDFGARVAAAGFIVEEHSGTAQERAWFGFGDEVVFLCQRPAQ